MKGGFYGLKGKQISFGLLALICTTILIWAWDKTPLLTSLIPPQSPLLQLPPEVVHNEVEDRLNQHYSDPKTSKNPLETSSGSENAETNVKSASFSGKGGGGFSEEEMKKKEPKLSDASTEKKSPEISNQEAIDEKESASFSGNGEGEVAEKEIKMQEAKLSDVSAEKESPESPLAEDNESPGTIITQATSEQVSDGKKSSEVTGEDRVNSQTSKNEDPPSREADIENSNSSTSSEACNYGKGKWVYDEARPLYSGFGCKQWLSAMWACRLTQRTDFAYEKLRWQPKDCAMEEFIGPKFLERMRDKTLAFIGDSLGRQQFQSLMCMATVGKESPDVADVGHEFGLVKAHRSVRPDGWAYRFLNTNTTILYYWSASLSDLEPLDPSNPKTDFAMHLDRPPWFLKHYIHKFDVLVLNTGHHWNRGKFNANRWVMHVGGKPNTNKKIAPIYGAKNFTIHSIVNWVDLQLPKYPKLKVFFRSISPRHFFNGDWNTGGTCDNTAISGVREVLQDESSDPVAASAVKGTQVKLLDITAISQLRDEGHISRYSIKATPGVQDCLHWCLPGVPDTWNEILFAQL